MPRLLPWLADDTRRDNSERSRNPTRRTPSPSNRDGAERASALQTTPRHIDVLRSSRSPPTSPIEAPPTEEYIKEGFDNDDMYIMVEDEFYAVAQQFTRHLHHAEYVKRRKQAKNMNASVLRDIARPTDGNTVMSAETLKRKETERLRERQKRGLAPRSRRPRTDEEEEEEEEAEGVLSALEEEEEREDDPWYGTSLHTLMASPRKNRSLAGLQSIRSSTRAAAGFRSAEVAGSSRNSNGVRRSVSSLPRDEQRRPPTASPSGADDDDDDDDDDDLEIIESKSSKPNPLPQTDVRVRTRLVKRESPDSDIKPALRRTTPNGHQSGHRVVISEDQRRTNAGANFESSTTHHTKPEPKPTSTERARSHTSRIRPRKRILLDELDDGLTVGIKNEEEAEESKKDIIIQDQPRRSLSTGNRTPEQQQERTAKRSRLNDIPTFLV